MSVDLVKVAEKTVDKIEKGDILLRYITGIQHWVGALEVIGPSDDTRQIWNIDDKSERIEFSCKAGL